MLDPSASDMFDAGNYRRRRTRRQRHAKMLLSGQFHQGSAFTIYPELMQRAHLQHAQAFALSSFESHPNAVPKPDYDDSENSDNDAATAEHHETSKAINALDDEATAKFPSNYLCHLDKLLKNQFLQQINFQSAINDSNRATIHHAGDHHHHLHHHDQLTANLMTNSNECKMNSKSTNFTIENLIRKWALAILMKNYSTVKNLFKCNCRDNKHEIFSAVVKIICGERSLNTFSRASLPTI